MKSLVVVLPLMVSILGVISKDLSSTGNGVQFEEREMLGDGNILDLVFDRKGKASKSVCYRWKNCCQKSKDQEKHYGLVVTGGDNPDRIASSAQISSMGVCVSASTNIPDLPKTIAGAKSVWIQKSKILMFCGGSDRFVGRQTQFNDGWGASNTCLRLTPGDTDWKDEPQYNMIDERGWFSLNYVNKGKIGAVAAGGSKAGYDDILDSMEKFYNGKWRPLLNKKGKEIKLDKPTYGHCAVQFNIGTNSFLMIIGGSNDGTNFDVATNAVTVYNLNTGKIIQLNSGDLPPVWAPACTKKGKYIYVSGGANSGTASKDVYKGTTDGNFVKIGSGLGAERSGHTMGVTSNGPAGQLFIAGGYNPSASGDTAYLKEIETSNDDGETWQTLTTSLTEGGEYGAMASVPAFTFKCE